MNTTTKRFYPGSVASHDLSRAIGTGKPWVLEGQPHYVAKYQPKDGAIDVTFCPNRHSHNIGRAA